MEPNRELPPVENAEQQPLAQAETKEQLSVNPENAANIRVGQQQTIQPTTATPTQVQPTIPPVQQPGSVTAADDSSTLIADDADLIEKEWVNKAKQIVEHTKHDPHLQTNEMSKFKAHYQKKRYNKDVKVSGG